MDTSAAIQVIDELAAIGTLSICFDGGEPLMHPDMERFVRRAKTHGMRVSMSTNGILIPRHSNVLRFVDKVKVSIDGPPVIHDMGRRSGAFEGAFKGARIAAKAGCGVAIRMTIGEHNVRYYSDVLAIAKELHVKALFQPAVGSIMNNANAPEAHSANISAYHAAIDNLLRLKATGEPVANETLCLRHLRNWPNPMPVSLCSGGRVEVAIAPDGGLFPCGRRGRHLQAPNVLTMGVANAFKQLSRPTNCSNCWCALTLAGCYLYRGDIRMLTGNLGFCGGIRATQRLS
jgi:MoaA/NifB/PqqE/SkfB family radical SAM enzyme